MIVGVVGSRDFDSYEVLCETLDELEIEITGIVSGGATGADLLGKRYAEEHNLEYIEFLPDWKTYGKSAGMRRNYDIIRKAEFVVAFWNGKSRGTKHSIDITAQYEKPMKVVFFTKVTE